MVRLLRKMVKAILNYLIPCYNYVPNFSDIKLRNGVVCMI